MTNRQAAKEALHEFGRAYPAGPDLQDEMLDWVLDKIAEYVISQIKIEVKEEGWDHLMRPQWIISTVRREEHDT